MCDTETINGVMRDGGYGEYVDLRSEAAVRLDKNIDPVKYAPLLCAGVTVFNGLRQQNITSGDLVAVVGMGGLGHLAIQYASKMGYRTVAISSSADKKNFATELGAHDYIDTSKGSAGEQLKSMGGASAILFTAPNEKLIPDLLQGLGPIGKLIILAAVGPVEINTAMMIHYGNSMVSVLQAFSRVVANQRCSEYHPSTAISPPGRTRLAMAIAEALSRPIPSLMETLLTPSLAPPGLQDTLRTPRRPSNSPTCMA
jgi:D-arabinose 1-dehydrogenase-like Zn-dependent alcohol dehydrogenase